MLRHSRQWLHRARTAIRGNVLADHRSAPLPLPHRRGFASVTIRDGRIAQWEQEYQRQQAVLAERIAEAQEAAIPIEIQVQLDDKQTYTFHGVKGVSTSIDILKHMQDAGVAKFQALASQIDGNGVVDLRAPLEKSCSLRLLEYVRVYFLRCGSLLTVQSLRVASRRTKARKSSGTRQRTCSDRYVKQHGGVA